MVFINLQPANMKCVLTGLLGDFFPSTHLSSTCHWRRPGDIFISLHVPWPKHQPSVISRAKRSFKGKIHILLKIVLEEASSQLQCSYEFEANEVPALAVSQAAELWDARETFAHNHIPDRPRGRTPRVSKLNLRYLKYSCT